MDPTPGCSVAEREWYAQKWRCAGVTIALVIWLAEVVTHPQVPFTVRWAFWPFFAILVPVFTRNTVRKWHACRGLTR